MEFAAARAVISIATDTPLGRTFGAEQTRAALTASGAAGARDAFGDDTFVWPSRPSVSGYEMVELVVAVAGLDLDAAARRWLGGSSSSFLPKGREDSRQLQGAWRVRVRVEAREVDGGTASHTHHVHPHGHLGTSRRSAGDAAKRRRARRNTRRKLKGGISALYGGAASTQDTISSMSGVGSADSGASSDDDVSSRPSGRVSARIDAYERGGHARSTKPGTPEGPRASKPKRAKTQRRSGKKAKGAASSAVGPFDEASSDSAEDSFGGGQLLSRTARSSHGGFLHGPYAETPLSATEALAPKSQADALQFVKAVVVRVPGDRNLFRRAQFCFELWFEPAKKKQKHVMVGSATVEGRHLFQSEQCVQQFICRNAPPGSTAEAQLRVIARHLPVRRRRFVCQPVSGTALMQSFVFPGRGNKLTVAREECVEVAYTTQVPAQYYRFRSQELRSHLRIIRRRLKALCEALFPEDEAGRSLSGDAGAALSASLAEHAGGRAGSRGPGSAGDTVSPLSSAGTSRRGMDLAGAPTVRPRRRSSVMDARRALTQSRRAHSTSRRGTRHYRQKLQDAQYAHDQVRLVSMVNALYYGGLDEEAGSAASMDDDTEEESGLEERRPASYVKANCLFHLFDEHQKAVARYITTADEYSNRFAIASLFSRASVRGGRDFIAVRRDHALNRLRTGQFFKTSAKKKDATLGALPTNLNIQMFSVEEVTVKADEDLMTTAIASGRKKGPKAAPVLSLPWIDGVEALAHRSSSSSRLAFHGTSRARGDTIGARPTAASVHSTVSSGRDASLSTVSAGDTGRRRLFSNVARLLRRGPDEGEGDSSAAAFSAADDSEGADSDEDGAFDDFDGVVEYAEETVNSTRSDVAIPATEWFFGIGDDGPPGRRRASSPSSSSSGEFDEEPVVAVTSAEDPRLWAQRMGMKDIREGDDEDAADSASSTSSSEDDMERTRSKMVSKLPTTEPVSRVKALAKKFSGAASKESDRPPSRSAGVGRAGAGATIAFEDSELGFSIKPARFDGPTGMGAVVDAVAPGGAADLCNRVGEGDQLITVNGAVVRDMKTEEIDTLLRVGAASSNLLTVRFRTPMSELMMGSSAEAITALGALPAAASPASDSARVVDDRSWTCTTCGRVNGISVLECPACNRVRAHTTVVLSASEPSDASDEDGESRTDEPEALESGPEKETSTDDAAVSRTSPASGDVATGESSTSVEPTQAGVEGGTTAAASTTDEAPASAGAGERERPLSLGDRKRLGFAKPGDRSSLRRTGIVAAAGMGVSFRGDRAPAGIPGIGGAAFKRRIGPGGGYGATGRSGVSEIKLSGESDDEETLETGSPVATSSPLPNVTLNPSDTLRAPMSEYETITCGAFAAHIMGFSKGGLLSLRRRLTGLQDGDFVSSYFEDWIETAADFGEVDDVPAPAGAAEGTRLARGSRISSAPVHSHRTSSHKAAVDPAMGVDHAAAKKARAVHERARLAVEAFKIQAREDVVMSQALSAIATAFTYKLDKALAGRSVEYLDLLPRIGFLVQLESLVSTYGKELGMLEDLILGIRNLSNVEIKLVVAPGTGNSALRRATLRRYGRFAARGTKASAESADAAAGDTTASSDTTDTDSEYNVDASCSSDSDEDMVREHVRRVLWKLHSVRFSRRTVDAPSRAFRDDGSTVPIEERRKRREERRRTAQNGFGIDGGGGGGGVGVGLGGAGGPRSSSGQVASSRARGHRRRRSSLLRRPREAAVERDFDEKGYGADEGEVTPGSFSGETGSLRAPGYVRGKEYWGTDRTRLVMELGVSRAVWACLPESLRTRPVRIVPLLFTQGINEMQTMANRRGASTVDVQRRVNFVNAARLKAYADRWKHTVLRGSAQQLAEALNVLDAAIQQESLQKGKHKDVLISSGDVVRMLHGVRLTCCKSGKDRTAMSVTLEQARLLEKRHRLPPRETLSVANALREHGVRLEVCRKNVGKPAYAFNGLQSALLPGLYRPPRSTLGTVQS